MAPSQHPQETPPHPVIGQANSSTHDSGLQLPASLSTYVTALLLPVLSTCIASPQKRPSQMLSWFQVRRKMTRGGASIHISTLPRWQRLVTRAGNTHTADLQLNAAISTDSTTGERSVVLNLIEVPSIAARPLGSPNPTEKSVAITVLIETPPEGRVHLVLRLATTPAR